MKKTLTTLAAILLASCSHSNNVTGKVIKEEETKPNIAVAVIYNVPRGRYYLIEDNSKRLCIAIVTNGEDPLNEGDEGSFELGKEFFSGRYEEYVDGKRVERPFTAYQLDGYTLK